MLGAMPDNAHPASKPGKGLCQLTADRTGTDHGKPRRHLGQGKDRFVGEVAASARPGIGGAAARAPVQMAALAKRSCFPSHLDQIGADKAALPKENIHPQLIPEPPG